MRSPSSAIASGAIAPPLVVGYKRTHDRDAPEAKSDQPAGGDYMAKKAHSTKKPVGAVSLKLTLSDLKKITAGGSSFGGDTWQQVKWGKIDIGLEPIEARVGAPVKRRAKKR